ncbi:MAG TPA: hypothetical protein VHG69_06770 [Thermoleophilaceae bacterium]|nr:hypothetical protein [Thermoleophilaceae bacterium]
MSFLIDAPWLYTNGQVYARMAPESAQGDAARALGAATIALFWLVSVSLYLNRPWTDRIAKACGADSGRDWMLNSGVLRIDHRRAGTGTHAVAALIFLTYPLWLWLGFARGRKARLQQG